MNTTELILAITMSAGIAGVVAYIAQDVWDTFMSIKDEEAEESFIRFKRRRMRNKLLEESWFEIGDEVIVYEEYTAIIIGNGLNDTVSIMLEDNSITDVPVNKIRKVVVL